MAKIKSISNAKTVLAKLAGSISKKDADIIEESIHFARHRIKRKVSDKNIFPD